MMSPDVLQLLETIGPVGIFFLILFKLWSDWDVRKKRDSNGGDPRKASMKILEEIRSVVYENKKTSEACHDNSKETRELLTDFLIHKNRK